MFALKKIGIWLPRTSRYNSLHNLKVEQKCSLCSPSTKTHTNLSFSPVIQVSVEQAWERQVSQVCCSTKWCVTSPQHRQQPLMNLTHWGFSVEKKNNPRSATCNTRWRENKLFRILQVSGKSQLTTRQNWQHSFSVAFHNRETIWTYTTVVKRQHSTNWTPLSSEIWKLQTPAKNWSV
jgi:hypothetical protein